MFHDIHALPSCPLYFGRYAFSTICILTLLLPGGGKVAGFTLHCLAYGILILTL
jgi:hypothetical protein